MCNLHNIFRQSHPARGARIEIQHRGIVIQIGKSHPARGARIEMVVLVVFGVLLMSHPARGARIEMAALYSCAHSVIVAPREGCAD